MGKTPGYSALRAPVCLVSAVLLIVAAAAPAQSFDAPVRERVVDLGRSDVSNGHTTLTCDYFGSFMVKQFDQGGEGADWIAIVPVPAGHPPVCTLVHEAQEKVIAAEDWCGYFQGAKQDFVFLNACNAHNGGSDFAVYDARSGTRIFEDTALDPGFGAIDFSRAADGAIALHYSRIVLFECTLPRDQAACWSQIESKLGLENAAAPVCLPYEKQMSGSVVAYPVEVTLEPTPNIRATAGEIRCWPPE